MQKKIDWNNINITIIINERCKRSLEKYRRI